MSDHRIVKNLAYLSLGSNIQPELNLPKAVKLLGEETQVLACSTAWRTPAVGGHGPDFLNAVILVSTNRSPAQLKQDVLELIEANMGRVRTEDKFAPRTIDIDILVFNGDVLDQEIWSQAHLAVPLSEVYMGLLYSRSGKSLAEISQKLKLTSMIEARPEILQL